MANLKNITDLPVAESAEGLNLIVEDNGSAKRIAASAIEGKMKTVNGISPDENGNVEVDIPEGFSGSWTDLKDKPFGEELNMLFEGEVNLSASPFVFEKPIDGFGDTINWCEFDGVVYIPYLWNDDGSLCVRINDEDYTFQIDIYSDCIYFDGEVEEGVHTLKIAEVTVSQLDKKYVADAVREFGPFYGICNDDIEATNKIVRCIEGGYPMKEYFEGAVLIAYFLNENTAAAPTLQVHGLAVQDIVDSKGDAISANALTKGMHIFVWRAARWHLIV